MENALIEFKKLSKIERTLFLISLLETEEINFTQLTILYVQYLKSKEEIHLEKESTLGSCLSKLIQNPKEGLDERCKKAIKPFVPDNFIKEYFKK